jgi:hypothetical protein
MGTSPLAVSITNSTQISIVLPQKADAQFSVTLIGPTDMARMTREVLTFNIGDTAQLSVNNFSDLVSITKDAITTNDVAIVGANNEVYGLIPNMYFEARNTIAQITDKCLSCCNNCRCFDVLYKIPPPILYFDEQVVEFPQVIMAKTLENIAMPKVAPEQQVLMYAKKANDVSANYNNNDNSVAKQMDLGRNMFCSYTGGTTSSGKI